MITQKIVMYNVNEICVYCWVHRGTPRMLNFMYRGEFIVVIFIYVNMLHSDIKFWVFYVPCTRIMFVVLVHFNRAACVVHLQIGKQRVL